ncbi:MAG: hypothetical protein IPH61_04640 [Bacteroidetes bacterium]|nr:hypothetical protein [Bacteroidota bacterium]
MLKNFIYSKEGKAILYCVHKALLKCIEYGKNSEKLIPENQELIDCFETLEKIPLDLHITEGLFESHQKRGEKVYPRILKIALSAFKDAKEVKVQSEETGAIVIPSPLHILYYTLIVPDQPQTAGYSLASCRTLLFNLIEDNFKLTHQKNTDINILDEIDEEGISLSMDSLSKNAKISARWPTKNIDVTSKKPTRTYTNILIGQFLSMKGITHLWFKNRDDAKVYLEFDDSKDFLSELATKLIQPKFRLSNKYEELPDTGEIINQLYGVPIPIKGADVVFLVD